MLGNTLPQSIQGLGRALPPFLLTSKAQRDSPGFRQSLGIAARLAGKFHGSKQAILPTKFTGRITSHPIHRIAKKRIHHAPKRILRISMETRCAEKLVFHVGIFFDQTGSRFVKKSFLGFFHQAGVFSNLMHKLNPFILGQIAEHGMNRIVPEKLGLSKGIQVFLGNEPFESPPKIGGGFGFD